MSQLVLSIDPASSSPGWTGKWTVDGGAVGAPIEVAGAEFEGVRRLSRWFLELFEQDGRPLVEPEALRATGRELFARWLGPVWDDVRPQVGRGAHGLLIRSGDRDALNLPWELIELSDGLPVGCDAAWSLRRTPLDRLASGEGDLLPGPLRVLFLAAAPIDGVPLDYEREEDAILQATGKLRGDVVLHFAETGSFEELADLVARVRPHVVHLSGHGVVTADGRGTFAFEDERGRGDSRDAEEIVADIFRGSTVRCVFFNGCQTAQAAAAGLCQALVAAGLPLAVGWSASVADDLATEFAQAFYNRLLAGEPLPAAAAHARRAIQKLGHRRTQKAVVQDATFALPQVYCATESADLFDRAAPPEAYTGPKTEYFLLGDGIKGLKDGFIGRRREVQRLVPALRAGDVTFAVITGLGGAGKSTLATRAANRLHADGFRLLPVRARRLENETAQACGERVLSDVIGALDRAFVAEKREDLHAQLTNADLPLSQRLALAINGMNELRLLLVIDNFEDAQELETRQIADPELAEFYRRLASGLTRGSAVIVTCRYLPEGTPTDQPTAQVVALPDWQEHEFLKYLRRDAQVDVRMRRGELSGELLSRLYGMFGGTPRFLEGVRTVLREIDADDLAEELERSPEEDGEADGDPGALEQLRDCYFREIFAERLYDALPAEAQQALSRLAVSELPLPLDGIASLCDCDDAEAARRLSPSLRYGLVQEFAEAGSPTLYHPPGLLRAWVAGEERLAPDQARTCHVRLAEFWKASFETDRVVELRVAIDVVLLVCREHAAQGTSGTIFCWASVRLARCLEPRSEWRLARGLLNEVPEQDRDASCLLAMGMLDTLLGDWKLARAHLESALKQSCDAGEQAIVRHNLATIAVCEGDYGRAREEFGRALEMLRAIGERAGEANTLHNLASIALNEGDYGRAREEFGRALEMVRAIGDRPGEADTFHQLGVVAAELGRVREGAALVAVCCIIDQAIGMATRSRICRIS